jgi:hypothetical protein
VQTVLSMALDVPVERVERETGTEGMLTVAETIVLLSRLGIGAMPLNATSASEFWDLFSRQHGGRKLLGIAFQLPRNGATNGHAWLLAGNRAFDPASGERRRLDRHTLKLFDYVLPLPEGARSHPSIARLRCRTERNPGLGAKACMVMRETKP